MSYLIVIREKRENVFDFDRETIFVHDIEFRDVKNDVIVVDIKNEKTNEKTSEKTNVVIDVFDVEENETEKIIFFDFLQCLMRTCSCSLMLFEYLTKQRLQTNFLIVFKKFL